MKLKSTSLRMDEEVWKAFRKKYGKKAFARIRELMAQDLEQ
jgi:hypothetical protein